jgi:hypothetical protein
MADLFSWLSRVYESIKGIICLALLVVAVRLLFWNEEGAARAAKSLQEGAGVVVSVPSGKVDPVNEGKLVHVTGEALTAEPISDPEFGVSLAALRLNRRVEMYQWSETRSGGHVVGNTRTPVTYNYSENWEPTLIDSTFFRERASHRNPHLMPVNNFSWMAGKVTLGAFTLSSAQVKLMNKFEDLHVSEKDAALLPPAMAGRVKLANGLYYMGWNPDLPSVGDTRITFQVVRPGTFSIIARQTGDTFDAYQAKAGGPILLVDYGSESAEAMFYTAEKSDALTTWGLRAGGFALIALTLFVIFTPLTMLAGLLPTLRSVLKAGIRPFIGLGACALTLATIGLVWLIYSPFLGILLLLLAAGGIAGLIILGRKREAERKAEQERHNLPIADLIGAIAAAMNLEAKGLGASTMTWEDLERGFEADSCFYIQNIDKIRNKGRVDFSTDPPPDLVVDIDITNPSVNKLVLFKECGVPEVWRYDGQRLEILRLYGNGYEASDESITLRGVSATAVTRLLQEGRTLGRTDWLRMIRAWAIEQYERPQGPISG